MTRIECVRASNPGPFTLEGTNTWVVGSDPTVVIDPGPEDDEHIEAVARTAGSIAAILLTHHHPDHAPAAAKLSLTSGAPVLAFEPEPGETRLPDGATVASDGGTLRAVHAPGHTADHLVFLLEGTRALFTGDSVLGRGTSVIDPDEGNLADYLASLERMLSLDPSVIYPGHGPVVADARAKLLEYKEHRLQREREVLAQLRDGARSAREMVPAIYAGYPPELHPLAARSVLAHLLKLEAEGRVTRVGPDRFELLGGPTHLPDAP